MAAGWNLRGVGGGWLAMFSLYAVAQTQLEPVVVTGSAIGRIEGEAALPVQVLQRQEIARSGATSTLDLLRRLPVMQGGTGESTAVGSATRGFGGVSIHNLGETRTLVLLNGHRLTQFGGQTLTGYAAAFDLHAIPLAAIERVEILTDGASSLYGADAIAGVVNFVTRRQGNGAEVSIGYSNPQAGAVERRFSATKQVTASAQDGRSVLVTFSHDDRTALHSRDRAFSRTGDIHFQHHGQTYRVQRYSGSAIPANVLDDRGQFVNPHLMSQGLCGPRSFRVTQPYDDGAGGVDDFCGYDFTQDVEIYPQRRRDAFFGSLNQAIGGHRLSADLLLSRATQTSRVAPVAGAVALAAGSPLHSRYLLPLGIAADSVAYYRLHDLGPREDHSTALFGDLSLRAEGRWRSWGYEGGYARSVSDVSSRIAGYPGALAVRRLAQSGDLDPFVLPNAQAPAGQAALAAANYRGHWDGGRAALDGFYLRGTREIGQMAGGAVTLAAGANVNIESFRSRPSLFAQGALADPVTGRPCNPASPGEPTAPCDQRFGDASATVPYAARRRTYGLFSELLFPVNESLELTASTRVDHASDFGSTPNVKGAFRWTPTPALLFRGSVGTGFRAPTVAQIHGNAQPYGVTAHGYACAGTDLETVAHALGAICRPAGMQYDVVASGNAGLRPEHSRQGTLGFRLAPSASWSVGADLWHVAVRNVFGQMPEESAFSNPLAHASAWRGHYDVATGNTYLAFAARNENLGRLYATGIDVDLSGRTRTGWGALASQLTLTYMVREVSQLQADGAYHSAIGNNAELGTVTFRWQGRWSTTWQAARWTHTLGVNFKAGYKDQAEWAERLDADGQVAGVDWIRLDVPATATVDWQSQWMPHKGWALTFGLLNVFDAPPPLSLAISGANRGQQMGYDDRYFDPRGRTFYANLSVSF